MRSRSLRVVLAPFLLATVLLIGTQSAWAQAKATESDSASLARQILQLTKAADLVVTGIVTAVPAQRLANPKIPGEFWDEFVVRATQEAPKLVEMMVPLYQASFTTSQLQELVAFYQSPLGRHLVAVQPTLAAGGMQAGQRWGAQIGAAVGQDLAKRGIKIGGQ